MIETCADLLTWESVGRLTSGGSIGVFLLLLGLLYLGMSVVIMYWIKKQELTARWYGLQDPDGKVAKSVIFPVFVNVMWMNSFVNFYIGCVLLIVANPNIDANETDPVSTITYSIIWGLQHAIIEGVAFLLMHKGLGWTSALKSFKYGIIWGAFTGLVTYSVYYYHGIVGSVYRIVWETLLISFYFVLWLAPQKHLYRRPSAVFYGRFWFGFRVLALVIETLVLYKQTKNVATCFYIFGPVLIFALFQPYITYYTLLSDSLWWQGLLQTPRNQQLENGLEVSSPLQGLNVNLHTAQSLADTLDILRNKNDVKLCNFAYITMDTSAKGLLGQGSFSKVYRGLYKQQECAIKLIFTVDLTTDVIQRVAAEAQLLSSIKDNPNVVNIYGVAVLPPSICLLLEICQLGSLSDVIKGRPWEGSVPANKMDPSGAQLMSKYPLTLTKADVIYLALGCARGLKAIHKIGVLENSSDNINSKGNNATNPDLICHRDIKSFNFLVDKHLNAKVADLELGSQITGKGSSKYGSRVSMDASSGNMNYSDGSVGDSIAYKEVFPLLFRTATCIASSAAALASACTCVMSHSLCGFCTHSKKRRADSDLDFESDDSASDVGHYRMSATSAFSSKSSKSNISDASNLSSKPVDIGLLPHWSAPEVIRNPDSYTQASDAYSFGMVLWEIFSKEIPFENLHSVIPLNSTVSDGTINLHSLLNNGNIPTGGGARNALVAKLIMNGYRPELSRMVHEGGALQGMSPLKTYGMPYALRSLVFESWDPVPSRRPTLDKFVESLERMWENACYDHIDRNIKVPVGLFGKTNMDSIIASHPLYSSGVGMATSSSYSTLPSNNENTISGSLSKAFSLGTGIFERSVPSSSGAGNGFLFDRIGSPAADVSVATNTVTDNACENGVATSDSIQIENLRLFRILFGDHGDAVSSGGASSNTMTHGLHNLWNELDENCLNSGISYGVYSTQYPFHCLKVNQCWSSQFNPQNKPLSEFNFCNMITNAPNKDAYQQLKQFASQLARKQVTHVVGRLCTDQEIDVGIGSDDQMDTQTENPVKDSYQEYSIHSFPIVVSYDGHASIGADIDNHGDEDVGLCAIQEDLDDVDMTMDESKSIARGGSPVPSDGKCNRNTRSTRATRSTRGSRSTQGTQRTAGISIPSISEVSSSTFNYETHSTTNQAKSMSRSLRGLTSLFGGAEHNSNNHGNTQPGFFDFSYLWNEVGSARSVKDPSEFGSVNIIFFSLLTTTDPKISTESVPTEV